MKRGETWIDGARGGFPTMRAWSTLLNRSVDLGQAILAMYASSILLFAPVCFALAPMRTALDDPRAVVAGDPETIASIRSAFPLESFGILTFGFAGLVALAFAGWRLERGVRSTAKTVDLLRDGTSADGIVVAVDAKYGIVEYRFSAPIGADRAMKSLAGRFVVVSRRAPTKSVGEVVPVVYDPLEPETSTLDWYRLRPAEVKAKQAEKPSINRS